MPPWISVFAVGLVAFVALAVGRWQYRRRRRYAEQWHLLVDPVPRLLNTGLLLFGLVGAVGLVQCVLTSGEPRPSDVKIARTHQLPAGARATVPPTPQSLRGLIRRLGPLHRPLGPTRAGDWLAQHKERGQTFDQYLDSGPVRPTGQRNTLYVQPIGHFDARQRRVLQLTVAFMSHYFCLPVKVARDLPLSQIPHRARRTHPRWGDHQILSSHVLDKVLRPRLPRDAVSYLALTTSDLWPGRGWNFVFGQASLRHRVGVWSIYRNGDPHGNPREFADYLLRTLKTATHETGHMLSMWHCTAHECNLCGANSREESDRRPLALCPQCLAKLLWATRCDAVRRFVRLEQFCQNNGLTRAAEYYGKARALFGNPKNNIPHTKRKTATGGERSLVGTR